MTDDEEVDFDQLKRRVIDALSEAVAGSDWAPPEGGVLVEAVAVMVWMNPEGDNGLSFLPATNHWWSTLGMLDDALRMHRATRSDDDDAD